MDKGILSRFLRHFSATQPERPNRHNVENVDYANAQIPPSSVRTFEASFTKLTPRELELAYRRSAIIFKGVNRKARDAWKKGFIVQPESGDRELARQLNRAANVWLREVGFKPRAMKALREALVFGDGFLELADFEGDKAASAMLPPPETAKPRRAHNVDPYAILPVKSLQSGEIVWYLNGKDVRNVSREVVKRWLIGQGSLPKGIIAIHPKRLVHYQVNSLREDPDGLGISAIETAWLNAVAKLAGDLSTGDVLEWYSKGFYTVNVEWGTPEEVTEVRKQIEAAKAARKNYFIGTERHKFDIKSPLVANLKPFYEAFYIEFAAALEMPVMVLLGVQKGTVTGSEVDLLDHYDDILAFQEMHLEAGMFDLMRRVLGRSDFVLAWVPLRVNKQTEADIRFKDAQSVTQLFNGDVLTRREALRFLESGELPNPDDVPDGYATDLGVGKRPAPGPDGKPAPVARGDPGGEAEGAFSDTGSEVPSVA